MQKSTPGRLKIECEKQTTKTFRGKYMYFIWLEKGFFKQITKCSNHRKGISLINVIPLKF